jgi:hypothetical protein
LDLGADDYLTKPFGIDAVCSNRVKRPCSARGDLIVDVSRRHVIIRGTTVHLSPKEYDLLRMLVTYAGRVLTHSMMPRLITLAVDQVWQRPHPGTRRRQNRDFYRNSHRSIIAWLLDAHRVWGASGPTCPKGSTAQAKILRSCALLAAGAEPFASCYWLSAEQRSDPVVGDEGEPGRAYGQSRNGVHRAPTVRDGPPRTAQSRMTSGLALPSRLLILTSTHS